MAHSSKYQTINKKIDALRERDLQSPTDKMMVQQTFHRLIIPSNKKRGGYIMSYEESIKAIKKGAKVKNPEIWTKEEYNDELNKFLENLGDDLKISVAKRKEREYQDSVIDDMNEYLETNRIFNRISIKNRREAFRKANEIRREKYTDDSYKFYEILYELLKGY